MNKAPWFCSTSSGPTIVFAFGMSAMLMLNNGNDKSLVHQTYLLFFSFWPVNISEAESLETAMSPSYSTTRRPPTHPPPFVEFFFSMAYSDT
jgi:hypothetical protein